MQLLSLKYEQAEGDVAPRNEHVCTELEEENEENHELILSSSSSSIRSHHSKLQEPPHFPPPPHVIPSGTSTYDIPGNIRKRKCQEVEGEENDNSNNNDNDNTEARMKEYLQLRRRLLLAQRKLNISGQTLLKLPLCFVYGDILHYLPLVNCKGNGGQGRGRRKNPMMPDLSQPIEASSSSSSPPHVSRPKTPSYHVQDSVESLQSLEECGFTQDWYSKVLHDVMRDLNTYGMCVVDDFLGAERADRILEEVQLLYSRGEFHAGQVESKHVQDQARGMIRGDKMTWVTGNEPQCSAISLLVAVVDSLVAKANKHHEAGKLADYNITWRTRAMVACYPGDDTHYVQHVDNPNGNGRCITAIYYLNRGWTSRDGGELIIYPKDDEETIASIDPCFDRMLFFWSDRRNPHEVLPTKTTRFAITVWYFDQKEREEYLARKQLKTGATCAYD